MRPAVSAARATTMGARAIVVSHVRQEYMTQMAFAKPHDIIALVSFTEMLCS